MSIDEISFFYMVKDECLSQAKSENPDADPTSVGVIAGKLARAKYSDYLQSKLTDDQH